VITERSPKKLVEITESIFIDTRYQTSSSVKALKTAYVWFVSCLQWCLLCNAIILYSESCNVFTYFLTVITHAGGHQRGVVMVFSCISEFVALSLLWSWSYQHRSQ